MKNRINGRFEGVAKIVRFNLHFYVGSALSFVSVTLLIALVRLPLWLAMIALTGTFLMVFWTLSSLLVSWYVYDHVGITRWEWMRSDLQHMPSRWANIHAGLDEATASLRHLLPGTDGVVVDIYDATTMTEPSIARARRMYPAAEPFQVGTAKALPLPDSDRSMIFLLLTAHEVRDVAGRTQLLRETSRVLKDEGRLLLVEHLRDLPNFIAFGPGFFHFHSRRTWMRSVAEAGFEVIEQREITPFVRCFTLRKVDA